MTLRILGKLSTLTLFFTLPVVLSATAIPVDNPSFETLPGSGLPFGGCGVGCSYSVGAIPGWNNSGSSGQFQPGTQDGNLAYFNSLPDGITVAYSNDAGGVISQTVGATVQFGVVYTLSVDLGWRNDVPFTASADLLINGTHYLAVGSVPVRGNWSTYTATYTGLSTDAGKPITIELLSGGAQANFDNVSLSDNSVPEPAMTWIVGGCLMGLGAFRRRK